MLLKSKRAFTLIELLVVVLIIGVLSAIALPQYTMAVEKSRATEAMTNIATIKQQMQLYIMENGLPSGSEDRVYYKNFSNAELSGGEWKYDTDYQTKKFYYYQPHVNNRGGYVEVARNDGENDLFTLYSTTYPQGESYNNDSPIGGWYNSCITFWSDLGRKICKQYESLGWKYIDGEI